MRPTILLAVLLLITPVAAQVDDAPATALLIIDIQDFYFPDGALPLTAPEAAAANAGALLAKWRADGLPVVHVGHQVRAGGDFHADVAPVEGEKVVMKSEVSCFKGSDLASHLEALEITRLVICGMQTHMCLEAAVRAASDLGFEVIVPGDACATRDLQYGETTATAAQVHAATLATFDGTYATVVTTESLLSD